MHKDKMEREKYFLMCPYFFTTAFFLHFLWDKMKTLLH